MLAEALPKSRPLDATTLATSSRIRIQPEALCGERMSSWYTSLLKPFADAKHVTVGMPEMHLSHVPRHVRRQKGYFKARCKALFVDGVYVSHPY